MSRGGLISRTETTTKNCKTEKLKSKSRYVRSNSKSLGNHVVNLKIGLDLSAAFDTVDHRLLLDRLWLEFGVTKIPLRWLQSYLEGRTQFIKMDQHESHATEVDVVVPQGSVLGPLLFAVYCSPIADVIAHHGVQYQ